MMVSLTLWTVHGTPLTVTATSLMGVVAPKPVPAMANVVPPRDEPKDGLTVSTTGVADMAYAYVVAEAVAVTKELETVSDIT